jgi:hypothetical protein
MAGKAGTGVVRPGDIGVFPFLSGPASGRNDGNGQERTDGGSVGTPHSRVKRNIPTRVTRPDPWAIEACRAHAGERPAPPEAATTAPEIRSSFARAPHSPPFLPCCSPRTFPPQMRRSSIPGANTWTTGTSNSGFVWSTTSTSPKPCTTSRSKISLISPANDRRLP